MRQALFVLSPCGTSLWTNEADAEERKLISRYANARRRDDIPLEPLAVLDGLISRAGNISARRPGDHRAGLRRTEQSSQAL